MAMNINTIKYYFKEGFMSLFHNRLMSLASVIAIAAVLIIYSIFMIFVKNTNYIADQIKGQQEIQVFLTQTLDEKKTQEIGTKIQNIPHVKEVIFEDKDVALQQYRESLADKGYLLDGLEKDNPLRNSYRIMIDDLSYADVVVEQLRIIQGIDKINNNKDVFDKLIHISDMIALISKWVVVVLIFIAILIISNTIKLAVFSRRKEINIMKFVGATDWFIRWPFIIEGIIIGLIGGSITFLIIFLAYDYFVNLFHINISIFELLPFEQIKYFLMISFISLGVGIGSVGSIVSIRKYLKV